MTDPIYLITRPTLINGAVTTPQANAQGDLLIALGTALSTLTQRMTVKEDGNTPLVMTVSGLARTGQSILKGFFLTSTTGGTVKIWDSTTATGTVLVETVMPTVLGWYELKNIKATNGLFVTLGGTAINITLVFSDPTVN